MLKKLGSVLKSHSSNHEIALALAIGVLVGFFPIYGPQMLLCLLIVLVFKRLNKVAIFVGVQISWIYPFMLYLDYQVGRLFVPGAHPQLRMADFRGKGIAQLWELFKELFPTICVGSVVAGMAAAAFTYTITIALLQKYRKHPQNNV